RDSIAAAAARNPRGPLRVCGPGGFLDPTLMHQRPSARPQQETVMHLNRRDLLRLGGATALAGPLASRAAAQHAEHRATEPPASEAAPSGGPADYTLRIATGLVELGSETIVSTKLYNGQFPGPLLRFTEGKRVVVDIHNDTDTPEQLHWHGQFLPI